MNLVFIVMTLVSIISQNKRNFKKENISPFRLKIGSVDSFSSALFVEIQDTECFISHTSKIRHSF